MPVYPEQPLNDSMLRDKESVFKTLIDGSERVVRLLDLAVTSLTHLGSFDDYLTITPKMKGMTVDETEEILQKRNKRKEKKKLKEENKWMKKINLWFHLLELDK